MKLVGIIRSQFRLNTIFSHLIIFLFLVRLTSPVVAEDIERKDAPNIHLIGSNCAEFLQRNNLRGVRDCNISEQGEIGIVNENTYYYVIYCIIPDYSPGKAKCGDGSFSARYHAANGLSIYVRKALSSNLDIYLERADPEIGTCIYRKPEIIKNSIGRFMYVPISESGSGDYNHSEYYLWRPNANDGVSINSESWGEDFWKRIPSGLSVRKGIWPDIRTMTAEASLYREGDANCCPTGGTAFIKFTLKDNQFVVDSVEFRKNEN